MTDAFLANLRQSHVVTVAAALYPPDGTGPLAVPVEAAAGEVVLDRSAQTRRTGSLQIPYTAELRELLVDPDLRQLCFGGYARVQRGILYARSEELCTVGHLRVESVSWSTNDSVARLELADRMAQVANEPLLAPYAPTGLRPSQAAIALVTEVFGGAISYTSTVPAASEPSLIDVVYADDRAAAVADLAKVVGAEAYFDELGNFRFDPLPDPASASPVFTIDAGGAGVMVDAVEALDRTAVVNGVLMQGQPDGGAPPVSALVVDSDPASPTRWGGPFGKVARVESSTAVQSTAQASAAAQALLNNQLGLERVLTVQMVPNPALVPGDVVQLDFPDGTSEQHVIESMRLPLDVESAAELVTRAVWSPTLLSAQALSGVQARRSYTGAQAWAELRARPRSTVRL
ncbi:MAG TPA: hypothetical protein VH834_18065 [Solirubrobacteraceae bacterium]